MRIYKATRRKWPFFLSFLALAAVLTLTTTAYASLLGTVTGTVTNGETSKALPGIIVLLVPTSGPTLKAVTDSTGSYVFAGIQPGIYTVSVSLVTFKTAENSIEVTQDQTRTVDFALETSGPQRGRTPVFISRTHPGDTAQTYTTNKVDEQKKKSQPDVLYQTPNLVLGEPGITLDPNVNLHIRGSNGNQVAYLVDGIDTRDPLFHFFSTNIVTVGVKQANLVTGGADVSYGNALGGFINQITDNGRDVHGGFLENTNGPGGGWGYSGGNAEYGGMLGGSKLDYYLSTINFKTKYPDNTQISALTSSTDMLAKFNYYADAANTVTVMLSHGQEHYNVFQDPAGLTTVAFDPATRAFTDTGSPQQDDVLQTYDLSHVTYNHKFRSDSFVQFRVYKMHQVKRANAANTSQVFQTTNVNIVGNTLDYENQLTKNYRLRAGLGYIPQDETSRVIVGSTTPFTDPNYPAFGYFDQTVSATPDILQAYVNNQFQTLNKKLVLDLGLRAQSARFKTKGPGDPSFTDVSYEPRVGATYTPQPQGNLTFRTSYGLSSQLPDGRRVEVLYPIDLGLAPTAQDPALQKSFFAARAQPFNRLGSQYTTNFDLGVEKGVNVYNEPYVVSLAGFARHQYDLVQLDRDSFDFSLPSTARRSFYTNEGHGHSSGFEFKLTKPARPRHQADWNGFLSYTNLVSKATTSDDPSLNPGYNPYFANADAGDTLVAGPGATSAQIDAAFRRYNDQEFAQSWAQRHTIGALVSKRINKVLETSVFLDAGSGYPFSNSTVSDGTFPAVDGQHASIHSLTRDADFSEVPVVLLDGRTVQPINPTPGYSGWHYKFSINTNFYLTENTNLFLNVDNVFDRKTVLTYSTANGAGTPYYLPPSPEYPQGRVTYGPATTVTPIFLSFGVRVRF